MDSQTISQTTYRRYILGKQGLWPGRRWLGELGTAQAIRTGETLQMDPVSVIARSHDIALWGRVNGYQPSHLEHWLFRDRQFFDYGGTVVLYPLEEFPFLRIIMEHRRNNGHWAEFARDQSTLLEHVLSEIRSRGPLRKSDFEGKKVIAYRASRDTGLALHCLWMQGELMTHSRQGIVRKYDLTENILPDHLNRAVPAEEAREFLLRKAIRQEGMITERKFRLEMQDVYRRPVEKAEAHNKLGDYLDSGYLERVFIDGKKESMSFLSEDRSLLNAVGSGKIPDEWQKEPSPAEVVFLSPLEYVSARGRAKDIFGVDYTWEIYKPAISRIYGPYTLPILFKDQIVARMDARIDRKKKTLVVNGIWLEERFVPDDEFGAAFSLGMTSFLNFLRADNCDLSGVEPSGLREQLKKWLEKTRSASITG